LKITTSISAQKMLDEENNHWTKKWAVWFGGFICYFHILTRAPKLFFLRSSEWELEQATRKLSSYLWKFDTKQFQSLKYWYVKLHYLWWLKLTYRSSPLNFYGRGGSQSTSSRTATRTWI